MFKFNGISSDEMMVIVEEEDLILGRAKQRFETLEIEGRDGSIYDDLGFSDIERTIKLQLLDNTKKDNIFSWLIGIGVLEYKNRVTTVRFNSELIAERMASINIIDCNFIRSPFWYRKDDEFIIVTNNVKNEGNIYSKPIIRLEKNIQNTIDVEIGGVRFIYNFDEDNYVEIDCDNKNALMDDLLRNRQLKIGYDFPKLDIDDNRIIIYSGDATIKIKRKDRWL